MQTRDVVPLAAAGSMFSMINFAKFTNLDFGQILGKVPPSKVRPSKNPAGLGRSTAILF